MCVTGWRTASPGTTMQRAAAHPGYAGTTIIEAIRGVNNDFVAECPSVHRPPPLWQADRGGIVISSLPPPSVGEGWDGGEAARVPPHPNPPPSMGRGH
jgi:hypothetical protein